ncbi:MAG: hypothetical protein H6613_11755 [Ignavibacteriales bacterium]|nr:hypothetical protein [Ignavibacteriales bacterium]
MGIKKLLKINFNSHQLNLPSLSFFIVLLLLVFISINCSDQSKETVEETAETIIEYDRFGFPVDSFLVVRGEVNKNETLADILIPNNFSYPLVTENL